MGRWPTAMRLARRFIVLWGALFWQGVFMSHGGVVVPVGGRGLGSDREQGFVTAEVTAFLNLAGARKWPPA